MPFNLNTITAKMLTCLLAASIGGASMQALQAATLSIVSTDSMREQIVAALTTKSNLDAKLMEAELKAFEKRAESSGLDEEVSRCYLSIIKNANNHEPTEPRQALLYKHLLEELADPAQVKQGRRNTCALATLEAFLYRKQPSVVCETVLAASADELKAADGTPIRIPENCLKPDTESTFFRHDGPYRSFASQLFQIAAANLYWQTQRTDPRGIAVPRGSISYIQFDGRGYSNYDSGERLTIQWSNEVTEFVTGADSLPESSPSITLDKISTICRMLTSTRQLNAPAILCHRKRDNKKSVITFASQTELSSILSRLKNNNAFPAIISVKPMPSALRYVDGSGPRRQNQGRWHVVCIDDFDSSTNEALIADFSSTSKNEALHVSNLYSMCCPAPPPVKNPAHMILPARPFLGL